MVTSKFLVEEGVHLHVLVNVVFDLDLVVDQFQPVQHPSQLFQQNAILVFHVEFLENILDQRSFVNVL